jgi:hypothetical protein
MEPIIIVFISYPEENKNKAGHSESEANKIENSIFFMHFDLAEEELHMIPHQIRSEFF